MDATDRSYLNMMVDCDALNGGRRYERPKSAGRSRPISTPSALLLNSSTSLIDKDSCFIASKTQEGVVGVKQLQPHFVTSFSLNGSTTMSSKLVTRRENSFLLSLTSSSSKSKKKNYSLTSSVRSFALSDNGTARLDSEYRNNSRSPSGSRRNQDQNFRNKQSASPLIYRQATIINANSNSSTSSLADNELLDRSPPSVPCNSPQPPVITLPIPDAISLPETLPSCSGLLVACDLYLASGRKVVDKYRMRSLFDVMSNDSAARQSHRDVALRPDSHLFALPLVDKKSAAKRLQPLDSAARRF